MSADPYAISLYVLQKIACSLSMLGSLMIISQVSRNKINRHKPQQRLILGISVVDFVTSAGFLFTDFFVPPWSGMLNARGNQATCEAQGFILQLIIISILYMDSLQIQYLLTIKYGWKEREVRKFEPYMHFISIGYGLASATAALVLDLFNPTGWDCWIAPYPLNCTSTYEINRGISDLETTDCIRGDNAQLFQWGFFYGLLWVSIVVCMVIMVLIIRKVRSIEVKTLKWATKNKDTKDRPKLKHTREVEIQSLLYMGGFFIVWTFPTISRLVKLFGGTPHPLLNVLGGTFIASQGIFNVVIYFRPRYGKLKEEGFLRKARALLGATLIFCCRHDDFTNDSKDVEETTPPQTDNSTTEVKDSSLPNGSTYYSNIEMNNNGMRWGEEDSNAEEIHGRNKLISYRQRMDQEDRRSKECFGELSAVDKCQEKQCRSNMKAKSIGVGSLNDFSIDSSGA